MTSNEKDAGKKLICEPLGYIHSPYEGRSDTPKNGQVYPDREAVLELEPQFIEGMTEIKAGDNLIVLFWFDRSGEVKLTVPFHGDGPMMGLFSTHAPARPNPIGVTTISVTKVVGSNIYFTGADMFDGTPVLDIKSAGHDM